MIAEDDYARGKGAMVTNSLEPRDGGAILGDAFRIYGRNLLGLWAIAAAVLLVLGVVGGVVSYLSYGADAGWHGDIRYLPLTWLLSLLQIWSVRE